MDEHFIKNIEIKNFKCFENFKAEGFGRVNLIGGKNNVGKTAFMEACYINLSTDNRDNFLTSIIKIGAWRDIGFLGEKLGSMFNDVTNLFENIQSLVEVKKLDKYFLEKITNIETISNINSIEFNRMDNKIIGKINSEDFKTSMSEFEYQETLKDNLYFNPSSKFFDNERMYKSYKLIQFKNKEDDIDILLKKFDKKVKKLKFIDDRFHILFENNKLLDLSELGDGIKIYLIIILDLLTCSNGYIFIDEIENGIHYSKLDVIWELILTISKEQNVQLFATTHSKECIDSYARVAKKLDDKKITMTTLAKNAKGEIKALVWNQKQFFSEMEQNHEVRGW